MEGCNENPTADLCSDITFEILTRVSLDTLQRCRLVSKEWRNLTQESNFIRLHSQRTGTVSGYFIQSMEENKYSTTFVSLYHESPSPSLDFLPRDIKIEASSNQGFLCCMSEGTRNIPRYYVCKPTTREWRMIPNPKTRYFTERTAMLVRRLNPLHYFIVRFSQPKCCSYNLRCEIFDSNCWMWKRSKDIQLPYSMLLSLEPAVYVNGAFHWLINNEHVFAFDIDRESWIMSPLPQELIVDVSNDYDHKHLGEYEGKLTLFYLKEDWVELWVMEDYSTKVWTKRQRVNLEALHREEPSAVPATLYSTNVALMKGFYKVIWYNFQNYSSTEVKIDKYFDSREIYPFNSDLEPSNMMNRRS